MVTQIDLLQRAHRTGKLLDMMDLQNKYTNLDQLIVQISISMEHVSSGGALIDTEFIRF